jgi:hypothetical protein
MIRKVMPGMAPAQRFAEVRGIRLHLDGAEGLLNGLAPQTHSTWNFVEPQAACSSTCASMWVAGHRAQ